MNADSFECLVDTPGAPTVKPATAADPVRLFGELFTLGSGRRIVTAQIAWLNWRQGNIRLFYRWIWSDRSMFRMRLPHGWPFIWLLWPLSVWIRRSRLLVWIWRPHHPMIWIVAVGRRHHGLWAPAMAMRHKERHRYRHRIWWRCHGRRCFARLVLSWIPLTVTWFYTLRSGRIVRRLPVQSGNAWIGGVWCRRRGFPALSHALHVLFTGFAVVSERHVAVGVYSRRFFAHLGTVILI